MRRTTTSTAYSVGFRHFWGKYHGARNESTLFIRRPYPQEISPKDFPISCGYGNSRPVHRCRTCTRPLTVPGPNVDSSLPKADHPLFSGHSLVHHMKDIGQRDRITYLNLAKKIRDLIHDTQMSCIMGTSVR